MTVSIHIRPDAYCNREEIRRICGESRCREEAPYFYAEIPERSEAHLLVIQLNNLYGVHARIVELGDANGAH